MIKKIIKKTILPLISLALFIVAACDRTNYNHIESNLSGTYVNQQIKGQGDVTSHFVAGDIVDGGTVILEQKNSMLKITYDRKNGHKQQDTYDLNSNKFAWHNGSLMYEKKEKPVGGILPGYAVQTRKAKLYKDQNGNLVPESSFTEKGLMLFIIPFMDSYKNTLILKKDES
jgi:hypothetical protein